MGVENLTGIKFPLAEKAANEQGVPRYTDNTTLVTTDYNGETKTFVFEEDSPPGGGGPAFTVKRFTTSGLNTTETLLHNLGNTQVDVTIQLDSAGQAGKVVMCNTFPTPGNITNSITVQTLVATKLHVTIIG